VIVNQGKLGVDYFVDLAERSGDGKLASNWFQQDVLRTLNDEGTTLPAFGLRPERLAGLLQKIRAKEIDTSRAREVFAAMATSTKSADEVMRDMGIVQVDESQLVELCRELLAANPKIVADIKEGKGKAAGALIGQAKKKNPNVNPGRLMEICLELAQGM
jgi:aspartyl-tRNA(Asn)/glutamyl-tRNA(Gln) amidotransferase subunit B